MADGDYGGRLRKSEWYVAECGYRDARPLVEAYHYAAGASKTHAGVHGLFRRADDALAGVAWWLPPTVAAARSVWHTHQAVNSLSRLVVAPGVPKNAATFFLSRSVKLLPARWECLVTYADTWRGHTGDIYRLLGWEYLGETKPRPTYVLDGKMISIRKGQKTLTRAQLLGMGAACVGKFGKHKYRLVREIRRPASPAGPEGSNSSGPPRRAS